MKRLLYSHSDEKILSFTLIKLPHYSLYFDDSFVTTTWSISTFTMASTSRSCITNFSTTLTTTTVQKITPIKCYDVIIVHIKVKKKLIQNIWNKTTSISISTSTTILTIASTSFWSGLIKPVWRWVCQCVGKAGKFDQTIWSNHLQIDWIKWFDPIDLKVVW